MDPVAILAKFEVCSFKRSEIKGGTQEIWAVPGYAHVPFSPKLLRSFYSDGPCEYSCQIWSS